jgi:hypothetical protein
VRVDPEIQRQMDELQAEHDALRGPSLMDAHRDKKREAKAEAKAKGGARGWNRDKDLDAGRKVDKNNLKNLMNGAAGLKDKFSATGAATM